MGSSTLLPGARFLRCCNLVDSLQSLPFPCTSHVPSQSLWLPYEPSCSALVNDTYRLLRPEPPRSCSLAVPLVLPYSHMHCCCRHRALRFVLGCLSSSPPSVGRILTLCFLGQLCNVLLLELRARAASQTSHEPNSRPISCRRNRAHKGLYRSLPSLRAAQYQVFPYEFTP